ANRFEKISRRLFFSGAQRRGDFGGTVEFRQGALVVAQPLEEIYPIQSGARHFQDIALALKQVARIGEGDQCLVESCLVNERGRATALRICRAGGSEILTRERLGFIS